MGGRSSCAWSWRLHDGGACGRPIESWWNNCTKTHTGCTETKRHYFISKQRHLPKIAPKVCFGLFPGKQLWWFQYMPLSLFICNESIMQQDCIGHSAALKAISQVKYFENWCPFRKRGRAECIFLGHHCLPNFHALLFLFKLHRVLVEILC